MICWLICDEFVIDLGVENRSKVDQKTIKKYIKNQMRFGMDFGWLLERSWGDLGPKLGAKLGRKSAKWKFQDDVKKCVVQNERRCTQLYASREGGPL